MSREHLDYFNRLAPEWESVMPEEPRLAEFFARFGIRGGERVLDVGAGTGRTSALIGNLVGARGMVLVQDLAFGMLREARNRRNGRNRVFCCSDARHLPVRDRTFDKVVCYSVFPHVKDKPGALQEMLRVLKPDGKLLILHSSSHGILNAFHATLEDPVSGDVLPSPQAMRRLMADAGLRVTACVESDDLYWAEAVRPR